MGKLAGKVAIVTGAARGLGAAIAEAICAEGGTVVVTDILADKGQESVAALKARGFAAEFAKLDVRDGKAWNLLVTDIVARHGKLDCLVNNAGICIIGNIDDLTVEDLQKAYDVNLIGPFNGMKAALPAMRVQGKGAIVNIASNSTARCFADGTVYASSKAALAALSKSVAMHGAKAGIRVNTVHPGPHATDMVFGPDGAGDSPQLQQMIAGIPMGRIGQPSDIGSAVAFLLSDEAGYMTGAEIFVDGGVTPSA